MNVEPLSPLDLGLAAVLLVLLGLLSVRLRLGLGRQLAIAAARTTVQLLLIGHVLRLLFAHSHFGYVLLISLVMLAAAGREVTVRQRRQLRGIVGFRFAPVRIEMKAKLSQNHPAANRAAVADALDGLADARAGAVAAMMRERAG